MDSNSQPRWHLFGGLLERDRPTAIDHCAPAARPVVISSSPPRVDPVPEASWESLGPAEQEAMVGLMAELSLRAVRAQRKV